MRTTDPTTPDHTGCRTTTYASTSPGPWARGPGDATAVTTMKGQHPAVVTGLLTDGALEEPFQRLPAEPQ